MNNIYIDIETIPDHRPGARDRVRRRLVRKGLPDDDEAVEQGWRDTALDGAFGQVVSVAVAVNDAAVVESISGLEEDRVLIGLHEMVMRVMERRVWWRWVGHNVEGFDLRFIWQRLLVAEERAGLENLRGLVRMGLREKGRVFDTMTEWAGPDGRISLGDLCYAFGVEGKFGGGADVLGLVHSGGWDSLIEYNRRNAELVREIHRRMR